METQASVLLNRSRCISIFFVNNAIFNHFLFLSLVLALTAKPVFAHTIVQGFEDRSAAHSGLFIEPRLSLYSTTDNFGPTQTLTPLANGTQVSRMYIDLMPTYGLSDDFFIFARLSWLSSKVTSLTTTAGSIFGFSDQLFGASYRIYKNGSDTSISIQAETTIPLYNNSNSKAEGNPYLGDHSVDLTLGIFGDHALPFSYQHDYFVSAGVGFTKRSYGFSSAIPWSVYLKRDPANGIYFLIGTRGQASLETDSTSALEALSDQTHGAGGSFIVNGTNASWLLGEAGLGYRVESGHLFYARGATPLSGKNAPSGLQVSVGMQFDFGAESKSSSRNDSEDAPVRTKKPKLARSGSFTSYDLEAKVTSANDQLYLVKINKGATDGIEKGQFFDIFRASYDSVTQKTTEKRIARAKVTSLKDDETALTVTEYFVEAWIEAAFTAKRVLQ